MPGREVPAALGAVAVMTIINIAGINRTALGAKVLASITVVFLIVLVGAALLLPTASEPLSQGSVSSVPAGAAIVFFAFAGYARVATLGGELVKPRRAVPRAIAIALLVLSGSFLLTLGLSSFAVLTYYAVANLAAYRQPKTETRRPKWLNLVGIVSCLLLALSVPVSGLLLGLPVISAMLFIRWALARRP